MTIAIYSTIIAFLNAFLSILVDTVVSFVSTDSKAVISLKQIKFDIQNEMKSVSITEEFAKHARLQRKLRNVLEELKQEVSHQRALASKTKIRILYSAKISLVSMCVALSWQHRYTPVVVLPEHWLYPLAALVAWPCGVPGAVSLIVWFMLANRVSNMVVKVLAA